MRFGGHSQAIGISVAAPDLAGLAEKWQAEAAARWDPAVLTRRYEYELTVLSKEIDDVLLQDLAALEPYGMANRQPVIRVGDLSLDGVPRRFGRGHLAARATGADGGRVDLLGWDWQARENDLVGTFEILATLERDRYHGRPVLRLLDARPGDRTASGG